jgi:tetratricopeptide (TPR) repeat protein
MDEMDRSKMNGLPSEEPSRRGRWARAASTPFVRVTAFVLERLVARRALILLFFGLAAGLALSGWIRPPLSRDISGLELPVGAWAGGWDLNEILSGHFTSADISKAKVSEIRAEDVLHGPRRILADSVGILLLAIIVVGALVALCRPRWFPFVAGMLLSVAICANAATVLNHPRLIYLLDLESEQRAQISRIYSTSYDGSMTSELNDRTRGKPSQLSPSGFLTVVSQEETVPRVVSAIALPSPIEEERGGAERGLLYVLRGPHLLVLIFVALIIGSRGRLGKRLLFGAAFIVLGAALTVPTCFQRLCAEWNWERAKTLEGCCDYDGARQALASSCEACPDFTTRRQTYLLLGKIDEAEGKATASRQLFRAFQAYRPKPRPGGAASLRDLPDWPSSEGPNPRESRWAFAAMDEILREKKVPHEVAATQAATFWMEKGLTFYLRKPLFIGSRYHYLDRERTFTPALNAWQRTLALMPDSRDALMCEGLVLARMDRVHPERGGAQLEKAVDGLADRPIKADILSELGDSYLEAGRFDQSLRFYMQSCDAYTLPKIVNHRGLKGLGGW